MWNGPLLKYRKRVFGCLPAITGHCTDRNLRADIPKLYIPRKNTADYDLVAANTCIIYDSDWNPQNDFEKKIQIFFFLENFFGFFFSLLFYSIFVYIH